MGQFTYMNRLGELYYLYTQSSDVYEGKHLTIHFLSKNKDFPNVRRASKMTGGRFIYENPINGRPKVYEKWETPQWAVAGSQGEALPTSVNGNIKE